MLDGRLRSFGNPLFKRQELGAYGLASLTIPPRRIAALHNNNRGASLGDLTEPRFSTLQCNIFRRNRDFTTALFEPIFDHAETLADRSPFGVEPPTCTGNMILRRAKKGMVPGGGFEPPTRGFSIRCSTN